MAVRNAQFFDEWEIQREGRTFDNLTEVEDAVDESTDKDSMDILLAIAARPSRLEDLKAASMEAVLHVLPPSTILEDDLLADRYDASKLDDNDNEESARFSGGEWAKIGTISSIGLAEKKPKTEMSPSQHWLDLSCVEMLTWLSLMNSLLHWIQYLRQPSSLNFCPDEESKRSSRSHIDFIWPARVITYSS